MFLICLLLFTLQSEPPEFGDFSELKGKHSVYVLTEDLEARKLIVREIEEYTRKGKVRLLVSESPDYADVFIIHGVGASRTGYNSMRQTAELAAALRGSPIANTADAVGGQKHRFRVVFSTRSSRGSTNGMTFERDPTKKAIRRFLDQLGKLQKGK